MMNLRLKPSKELAQSHRLVCGKAKLHLAFCSCLPESPPLNLEQCAERQRRAEPGTGSLETWLSGS